MCTRWHILLGWFRLVYTERLDKSMCELVLQCEDITQRHLRGLRPEDSASACLDELCVYAQLVTSPQKRAREHDVHIRFARDRF